MTHTLINTKFLKELMTSLQSLDLAYIGIDQGQADDDLGRSKYLMIKYPAVLIQIAGEEVTGNVHELLQASGEITYRLFVDCSLFANINAPEANINTILSRYSLLEEIIAKGKECGLEYQGFSEMNRAESLTEFRIQFLRKGHLSN